MYEPVQWIALAFAMVNKQFADLLYREVGPNGFYYGAAGLVYNQIELGNADKIREILGLQRSGKLSRAVLNYLAKEAMERWALRTRQPDNGRARLLVKQIDDSLRELLAMARHDGERR